MHFKLTDLIGWGKADARIYMDALKDGVNPATLEEQLQIRGELFELDVLRDLRIPQLMELIRSWGRKPADFYLEDAVKDIQTRKPNRKLIIEAKESPSFINRYEAEISIVEEQNGEWKKIQSSYPGFLIANNNTEMTIDDEINRTTQFLERRYLPDLAEKEFEPAEYEISRCRVRNIREKPGKTTADLEIEITKNKPETRYTSAQEYWQKATSPLLQSKAPSAKKKLALLEFQRAIAQAYSGQAGQTPLLKAQKTIALLSRMLDTKIKSEKGYTKLFVETELPQGKTNAIYIDGLLEAVTDDKIIEKMLDHEIQNKFYTEPFRLTLKNVRIRMD